MCGTLFKIGVFEEMITLELREFNGTAVKLPNNKNCIFDSERYTQLWQNFNLTDAVTYGVMGKQEVEMCTDGVEGIACASGLSAAN